MEGTTVQRNIGDAGRNRPDSPRMTPAPAPAEAVDDYLASQSPQARRRLSALRRTIRRVAPDAEELLWYNMPAFRSGGVTVAYAAFKAHTGFYPGAAAVRAFQDDLAGYAVAKGSIRFPLDRPLPLGLVEKIVAHRFQGPNMK
jgi:uncharacterized protein YdhG (YjbR/CyaY superfamily)